MNEQGKNLIEDFRWGAKSKRVEPNTISYSFTPEELELFSERVIKECVDLMMTELRNTSQLLSSPPQSGAIWDARNKINKHFGIEQKKSR